MHLSPSTRKFLEKRSRNFQRYDIEDFNYAEGENLCTLLYQLISFLLRN